MLSAFSVSKILQILFAYSTNFYLQILGKGGDGMQKLKYAVLANMIEKNCTSAEVDFIVYLTRFQNDYGKVKGVYYKEICNELGISHQTFYDLKKTLGEKGILRAGKKSYFDWDIEIVGNQFPNQESYSEGYINMNHDIFYNKDFFSMKAGEKLLAMHFLKISFSGRGSYNIGVEKFYVEYAKLFNVTKRVIQNYMTTLKRFFSIGVKERQYWITPLAKVYRSIGAAHQRTDDSNYNKQLGKAICRRQKIKFNKDTLTDTMNLLKQYRKDFKDRMDELEELLVQAIKKSIEKANEKIKNPRKWERVLQPKLVHKFLSSELYSKVI